MDVKLIAVEGEWRDSVFPVEEPEFLIGRAASCQLQLDHSLVDLEHCRIRREGERVFLEDSELDVWHLGQRSPGATDRVARRRSGPRRSDHVCRVAVGVGRTGRDQWAEGAAAARLRARRGHAGGGDGPPGLRADHDPQCRDRPGRTAGRGGGEVVPAPDRQGRGRHRAGQHSRPVDHPRDRDPADWPGARRADPARPQTDRARLRQRQAHVEPGRRGVAPGAEAVQVRGRLAQAVQPADIRGRSLQDHQPAARHRDPSGRGKGPAHGLAGTSQARARQGGLGRPADRGSTDPDPQGGAADAPLGARARA